MPRPSPVAASPLAVSPVAVAPTPGNLPSHPAMGRRWYAVVVIMFALVLSSVDRQVLTLLVQPIQASLRLSDTQMSLLYGLAFVGLYATATLGVGWLADRHHRPTIIAVGVAAWSVMTASCGLASSFPMLLLSRAGVGAGEASVVPAGYSLVGDHFSGDQRGRVIGVLNGVVTLGGGSALIIGALVIAIVGSAAIHIPVFGTVEPWQATFLLLGGLGLPFALVVWTIGEPRKPTPGVSTDSKGVNIGIASFLGAHKLTFLSVFGAAACNAAAGIGLLNWAPTLLIRRFSVPASEAGVLIGAALIIGGIAGSLIAASRSDRWMRSGALGGRSRGNATVFAIAACGSVLLAFGPGPLACAAGFGLVAYGLNAVNAVSYAGVQDLTPSHLRSRSLAVLHFTISVVGYSLGSSLIALLTDHVYGDRLLLGWAMVTGALPLFLGGALLSFFGRAAVSRTQSIVAGLAQRSAWDESQNGSHFQKIGVS